MLKMNSLVVKSVCMCLGGGEEEEGAVGRDTANVGNMLYARPPHARRGRTVSAKNRNINLWRVIIYLRQAATNK